MRPPPAPAPSRGPFLRLEFRSALSSGRLVHDTVSVRQRAWALRWAQSFDVTIDERVFARQHPPRDPTRWTALVVARGRIVAGDDAFHPGDVVLADAAFLGRTLCESSSYLLLDWETRQPTRRPREARRVGTIDPTQVRSIGERLRGDDTAVRSAVEESFHLLRELGAPVPTISRSAASAPTEADRRAARAFEALIANILENAPSLLSFGEPIGLSERQARRQLNSFLAKWGIHSTSWRDARNRFRVQQAVILLGHADLDIHAVAREAGYATTNALARAFREAGFPTPAAVRRGALGPRAPRAMTGRDPCDEGSDS